MKGLRIRCPELLLGLSLWDVCAYGGSQYRLLKSFGTPELVAQNPQAPLLRASDGILYGTAAGGSNDGFGRIFKLNQDGSGFAILHVFSSSPGEGRQPTSGLLEGADRALYGTTCYGGEHSAGTLFKLNKDGSRYQVLFSFHETDGQEPRVGLVLGADGALYGTTYYGGGAGKGTVFKLTPDGSNYEILHEFATNAGDGQLPWGTLLRAKDGALYGTAEGGGKWEFGVIYSLDADGRNYRVLYDLASRETGRYPVGALAQGRDGALYGTTFWGGTDDVGVVFRIRPDGSSYHVLRSFSANDSDAGCPVAGLLAGSDGALYGTTDLGGNGAAGAVFTIQTDGSGYRILHGFGQSTNDALNPQSSLITGSDGALYGTTYGGGTHGMGTVFKLNCDGSGYQLLHHFANKSQDAWVPSASLLLANDGALYGVSRYGGTNSAGTVFKLDRIGANYRILHHFGSGQADGRWPEGRLIQGSDGALYGLSSAGGLDGTNGTAFKIDRDGDNWLVLHHFNGLDGAIPTTLVEGTDGWLYGTTTQGGNGGGGTLFKLAKDGLSFAVLRSLGGSSSEAKTPTGGLIEASDGALYGTSREGGAAGKGTIFRLNPNGTGYVILHQFNSTPGDGRSPWSALVEAEAGALFGTTQAGGRYGSGTIFKLNKDGTGYQLLHEFGRDYVVLGDEEEVASLDGSGPTAELLESDGFLYGTTWSGGSENYGTVFRLNEDGSNFLVLRIFTRGTGDARAPQGGLVRGSEGAFYGATALGGAMSGGTIFQLFPPETPELLKVRPGSNGVQITVQGVSGNRYELLRSSDLSSWSSWASLMMGPTGLSTNTDTPASRAFFRAVWKP